MHRLRFLLLLLTLLLYACATPSPVDASLPDALSPARGVVVSGRLDANATTQLHAAGFRQIIDLTLDEETPGFDEAAVVRAAGMNYANLPLRGAEGLTRENVRAFDAMLRAAPRPVLVHCSSGNRVGAMAALRAAWIDGRSEDAAIAIGRRWGLKGLEAEVRARINAGR